jgi:hypothetical protein
MYTSGIFREILSIETRVPTRSQKTGHHAKR